MPFQEKQEQGYTFSIHNIWFCHVAAQMCGLKWQQYVSSAITWQETASVFELPHDKTNKTICAPAQSDQSSLCA